MNTFAISSHTALILGLEALKSYFKLTCEYELHALTNTKVRSAKDHGKNYINVEQPLGRHLQRNRLLTYYQLHMVCSFGIPATLVLVI